ncbi:polysaccharide deacetylase [Xanthocytophaga flava]|uniref:polysaccharide deacetylase n=1 Tax=Xanthocytophaga flava TaxID=3048013 RepID=UPI0028D4E1A3|nr:polysaccharide deacetylase [Xanthocytophaga flavus]MDJ1467787.1 polysaccharide deacetylase [Xanthocytophaga flavus]
MFRIFITALLFIGVSIHSYGQITAYQVFYGVTISEPQQIILREWQQNNQQMYLLLNPYTLETSTRQLPLNAIQKESWNEIENLFQHTPYIKALHQEKGRDSNLQDAGIQRTDTTERGFSLTIDLCPSSKPLARSFFEQLITAFEPEEKPIPITITITGIWIQKHMQDLAYLKNLVNKGELDITWVNHSYHHYYSPSKPLPVNFLLAPNTKISDEVLLNEQYMLENGLTPSIFFRFPGLISDKAIFDQVLAFGLLPIGSDAWLAKKQQPKQGSLVLVHANGNEPVGLQDFIQMIKQKSNLIRKKAWLIYELPTSIVNFEGR